MEIVSEIISQIVQIDGRISVLERHTYKGKTYNVPYLADANLDINAVLSLRGENIKNGIDARDAAIAEASNFRIPITRIQYVRRFTSVERQDIDIAGQTNAAVKEFLNMLTWTEDVDVGSPEVQYSLAMFEQAGLIGPGRAAEIGTA